MEVLCLTSCSWKCVWRGTLHVKMFFPADSEAVLLAELPSSLQAEECRWMSVELGL